MTHVGGGGSEQFSDEDRVYAGSRFRDVVAAAFANPYQQVWGREGEPPLPNEAVTMRTVFGNLLSRHWNRRFERASERAVDSRADLRWGPDRKGFRRFLHPNGICLTGRWQITEATVLRAILLAAARRSSLRGTRAARAATSAGRSDRSLSSANSIRRRIRTTRSHCGRRTSSRRRTSVARGPSRSTRRSCATRRT